MYTEYQANICTENVRLKLTGTCKADDGDNQI